MRQASPIAFAREQDKDPSNDLVGDGHGHFYTVANHPANVVVQRVAPMIRKLAKVANSVAPSAPRKQASTPAPKPIIVHRNNPIQQKISNALNNTGSSSPTQRHNFETGKDDKKDDSDKTADKSKGDKKDESTDKSKDDKKDDSKKDDNSSTVPDANDKSSEPSHNKAGDYSVSMKNKDPKMKDADKQVKSVKKKQNSGSLVWTIVIIFVVLGAAAAGGFYWYKKRQEDY